MTQDQSAVDRPVTPTGRAVAILVIVLCDLLSAVLALYPFAVFTLLISNYVIGPRDPTINDDPSGVAYIAVVWLVLALVPCVVANAMLRRRTGLPHWFVAVIAVSILVCAWAIVISFHGVITLF